MRPSGPAGTETADPAAFCTPRPLLVLYPEVGMSDFVQDVSEHDALSSHLLEMFGERGERTPEWARMVRPVVSAAAEPATCGARRPRARARRPSGLQSSAAAARPPAVPPWSLSLVEGAAQSVGLDIQARATPTTAWRGAIALARPRWAAWACTTEMAARTRPGWRLPCPRHPWRCSRPAPPTTSSSRCPRRGRARCHASCSAYHDSIEPCVAHCRVQDARPPAATPPSALLHHPPHTITRPHPPRCATGGARRRW